MFGCLVACFKKNSKESTSVEAISNKVLFKELKYTGTEGKNQVNPVIKEKRFVKKSSLKKKSSLVNKSAANAKPAKIRVTRFEESDQEKHSECAFCKGKDCEEENWKFCVSPSVEGLHSSTIKDSLIVSQRPSNKIIADYQLECQFERKNIGLIVNCQAKGEHANCGPGVGINGFSYDPTQFEDIQYFHLDFAAEVEKKNIKLLYRVLRKMADTVVNRNQTVFIHCHSGKERSCALATLYLMFTERIAVTEAINTVEKARENAFQTRKFIDFFTEFREKIKEAKTIFPPKPVSIEEFMRKQQAILFVPLSRKLAFTPRILSVIFERMSELAKTKNQKRDLLKMLVSSCKVSFTDEMKISKIKKSLNNDDWSVFKEIEDYSLLASLLEHWLLKCVKFVVNPVRANNICYKRGLSSQFTLLMEEEPSEQKQLKVLGILKRELKQIEFYSLVVTSEFLFEFADQGDPADFVRLTNKFGSLLGGEEEDKNSSVADCLRFLVYLVAELGEIEDNVSVQSKDNSVKTGDQSLGKVSRMTDFMNLREYAFGTGVKEKEDLEGTQGDVGDLLDKFEKEDKLEELYTALNKRIAFKEENKIESIKYVINKREVDKQQTLNIATKKQAEAVKKQRKSQLFHVKSFEVVMNESPTKKPKEEPKNTQKSLLNYLTLNRGRNKDSFFEIDLENNNSITVHRRFSSTKRDGKDFKTLQRITNCKSLLYN